MKDFYSTLGLEKNATDAEIKKAYRKKAQEFHPDKNQGKPEAELKFKEIQEAYEVLSDKQKRDHYDRFGSNDAFAGGGFGSGGFDASSFEGFADIFENFFGMNGGGNRESGRGNSGPVRGGDIETSVELSFEESIFGASRQIELNKPETCGHCKGNGAEPGTKIHTCQSCNGQGRVRGVRRTILGNISTVQVCGECEGLGQKPEKICSVCQGQMRVKAKSVVEVAIPKGIEDGTTIRLKEKGSAGIKGGPHGDLFLHINVRPHLKFSRKGSNIHSTESIHMLQAALGGNISVETVHGRSELQIPAGIQHGTELTIKGKGAPSLRREDFGDHKLKIHVRTPENLSKEERQKYTEIAKSKGLNVNESTGFFF